MITRSVGIGVVAFLVGACEPPTGRMPTHTFAVEDPDGTCSSDELEDSVERTPAKPGELSVASVLGCHVTVLADCHATSKLASTLTGACPMATHVVRDGRLEPLSLADYALTGTFKGHYRQPDGPYHDYDTTFFLAQDGEHVNGISKISASGHDMWGDAEVEGKLSGNVLFFRDVRILDDNLPPGMGWCLQGGYLVIDPRDGSLHGPATAPCSATASVELRRTADRPRIIVPGGQDGS